jgi:hypothetical protein
MQYIYTGADVSENRIRKGVKNQNIKSGTSPPTQDRNKVVIVYSAHFTGELGRRNYK